MLIAWTVRVSTGLFALFLVLLGKAIEEELAARPSAPVEYLIPLVGDLVAAALAYVVFAHWSRTRVVYTPDNDQPRPGAADHDQIRAQIRRLSTLFLFVSGVLIVSALWLLFLLASAAPTIREVFERRFSTFDLGLAMILGVGVGVVGLGLRGLHASARLGAIVTGFLFFGGIPFGTAFALYAWWVAASPPVKDAFLAERVAA